jgi:hypothetical protein
MNTASIKKRNASWYLRFVLACWGVGWGLCILLAVLSLPFSGYDFFDYIAESSLPMLIAGVVASPLIWRYLR